MRCLTIITMLFSAVNLFGQVRNFKDIPENILERLDKMGVDNSPLLNCCESAYFNVVFEKSRKDFDFTAKKIGFITGSSGKIKSNKVGYFKLEKDRYNRNYSPNGGTLYIFNATQKKESGDYDAVIIYWSKALVSVKDAIKRLKEN